MKRHLVQGSRMIHSMGWEDGVMEVEQTETEKE